MKTIDEQFENEQDYSQNDLSATELTAGGTNSFNFNSLDDSAEDEDDSDDDTDLNDDDDDLEDDEPIFNDDDNEDYGTADAAGATMSDNMDDDPDFTGTRDV